jgi:carbon monoxide dehydrogenase subunit G
MPQVANGSLVLADIGGYTEYLGGVELEHSHDILADLLGVVTDQLVGPLRLAKLEGDAVFCFDAGDLVTGEGLLTALQSCYFAFERRQRTISVATSCECAACRRIPDLNLKFLAHNGSFVEHDVAGSRELVGVDVVLAHRLLKNSVTERTGLEGYALLTAACVEGLDIDPHDAGLAEHQERYDDVGDVAGWLLDLESRWREEQQHAAVAVIPEEAAMILDKEIPLSPAVLWDVMTDPKKQKRWRIGADAVEMENPGGARGVGSTTHCVHGKTTIAQEILDWKPYDYYTYSERNPVGQCLWTIDFEPLGEGERTRLRWLIKLTGGGRQQLAMLVFGRRMRKVLKANLDGLAAFVEKTYAPAPSRVSSSSAKTNDA